MSPRLFSLADVSDFPEWANTFPRMPPATLVFRKTDTRP